MDPAKPEPQLPHYTKQTPELAFQHTPHDPGAASQHLLLTEAISAAHPACPAVEIHANDPSKDCTAITPLPLFTSHTTVIELSDTDFNRIGIVLESRDAYLTVIQPIDNTTRGEGPKCGWLSKARIGSYLVMEWESLPKTSIGKLFTAAMGEHGKGWNVHSNWMMELRKYAGNFAVQFGVNLELHKRRAIAMGAELPSQHRVRRLVTEGVEKEVSKKVRDMVMREKERREMLDEEARSVMEDCLHQG